MPAPKTWLASLLWSAVLTGCVTEASPSVVGAIERRAVVVPARRATAGPGLPDASEASCLASCPPARDGEQLAGCHPSRPDRRVAAPRGAPREPPDEWVVCYFEAR